MFERIKKLFSKEKTQYLVINDLRAYLDFYDTARTLTANERGFFDKGWKNIYDGPNVTLIEMQISDKKMESLLSLLKFLGYYVTKDYGKLDSIYVLRKI